MNSEKVSKFIAFRFPAELHMWSAVAVPVLLGHGIAFTQVFQLLSYYNIANIVLEGPTSTIATRLGDRMSIVIGTTVGGFALFLFNFQQDIWYYYLTITLLAYSSTLISRSDESLIHKLTKRIKSQTYRYKIWSNIAVIYGALLGGVLLTMMPFLPLWISSFLYLSSATLLLVMSVPGEQYDYGEGNLIEGSWKGFLRLSYSPEMYYRLVQIALFTGLLSASKFFLSSFGYLVGLTPFWIGAVVAISIYMRLLGHQLPRFSLVDRIFVPKVISILIIVLGYLGYMTPSSVSAITVFL